jgi:hypothetical protein
MRRALRQDRAGPSSATTPRAFQDEKGDQYREFYQGLKNLPPNLAPPPSPVADRRVQHETVESGGLGLGCALAAPDFCTAALLGGSAMATHQADEA